MQILMNSPAAKAGRACRHNYSQIRIFHNNIPNAPFFKKEKRTFPQKIWWPISANISAWIKAEKSQYLGIKICRNRAFEENNPLIYFHLNGNPPGHHCGDLDSNDCELCPHHKAAPSCRSTFFWASLQPSGIYLNWKNCTGQEGRGPGGKKSLGTNSHQDKSSHTGKEESWTGVTCSREEKYERVTLKFDLCAVFNSSRNYPALSPWFAQSSGCPTLTHSVCNHKYKPGNGRMLLSLPLSVSWKHKILQKNSKAWAEPNWYYWKGIISHSFWIVNY